jgi:hypothetical protein
MFHARDALRIGLLAAAGASMACGRESPTPPILHDAVPARILKSVTDTLSAWLDDTMDFVHFIAFGTAAR